MSIQEIPKQFVYTCDFCGAQHTQKNASGHYTNSTPPEWMTIRRNYYETRGSEELLCLECAKIVNKDLEVIKERMNK